MLDISPTERMKRKVLKENLWFFILKLIKEKPRYGNELRKTIEKQFGFLVGNVTAYKVLYDLESQNYVKVEGDYKKKYTITKLGLDEMKNTEKFLKDLIKGNKIVYNNR
ncbi:MAG: PadR family transcriptional regulator, partial [Candidatus Aenigmarchaeota archaeon]|nr:PadR family transcriptional regulator [Candidatus Aenigmarchaeota archaeon]